MSKLHFSQNKSRNFSTLLNLAIASHNNNLARNFAREKGHRMVVFAHDYIGTQINQFGVYEADELDILFKFLAPVADLFRRGMALDIGANIGNHSIYFADYFAQIHAFEPNPTVFELLTLNAREFDNITPHNFGLGDEKGTFTLNENLGNAGRSSIVFASGEAQGRKQEIHVDTIDTLELELSELCFIKLDVEGFEPRVLAGAVNTITKYQPVIVLEQHRDDFTDGSSLSLDYLAGLGYQFCWYETGASKSSSKIIRTLQNIKELALGREHRIVSGSKIFAKTYPMLISVPPRFQSVLLG